jgi:Flp pilus assembly protein TadG
MKHLRSENGQSLIEGALMITLLMVIILGLIDFAFIFQAYLGVVSAASVGITYAATSSTAANDLSGITAAALSETDIWHCIGQPNVTRTLTTDSYGYSMVSVTITCRVADLMAIPSSLNNVQVSATAVRRVKS